MIQSSLQSFFDRFGALASSLCAVHCALVALLPAALAALGLGSLLNPQAEWAFTLIAIAFALGALGFGFKRHRSTQVVVLFVLGIAMLLGSRIIEESSGHHHDHGAHHAPHDKGHAGHHEDGEAHHDKKHHEEKHAEKTHEEKGHHGEAQHHGHDHHDHATPKASSDGHGHDEGDAGHLIGTIVGVLGGLLLLLAHILNLRATRRCEDCE